MGYILSYIILWFGFINIDTGLDQGCNPFKIDLASLSSKQLCFLLLKKPTQQTQTIGAIHV